MDERYWPSFLNLLDADPDKAFDGFYRFTVAVLTTRPPRPMLSATKEEREDLIHDIVYHCVRDNFRVLRLYRPKGRPFTAWLYVVAHNKCLDWLRVGSQIGKTVSIHGDGTGRGLENVLADRVGNPENRLEASEITPIIRNAMGQLGSHCRTLLELAADELTPKEMVLLLGLPVDQNKKISDDLRYCRKKLVRLLEKEGIDFASFETS
jgi:RNA polymerase sigma factor (sigma-70 family)